VTLHERHLPVAPEVLLSLPIDERGIGLLRTLVEAEDRHEEWDWVHAHNLLNRASWGSPHGRKVDGNVDLYLRGVSEAWAWLVSQGLLARRPDQSSSDAYFVTQRGRALAAQDDPRRQLRLERRLSVDLHPRLEKRIRSQFLLGEVELAAFAAMREVEIRVRELAGLSDSVIGVKLMRTAFGPGGPLRQPDQDPGEQDAVMNLFVGAIGTYKNPSSHRQVDYSDPSVAAEVVILADLLLRTLDELESGRTAPR
jgi:uncharacterized protein (TIGR02391 family)